MKIRITSKAELDIEQAYWFYESQQAGLGNRFRESVLADIDTLETRAGIHRIMNGAHCLLVSKFPFMVYYKVLDEVAIVIAVLDSRRGDEWLQDRLS